MPLNHYAQAADMHDKCILGDAAQVLCRVPSACVDLILTDPPWGTSALDMDAAPPVPPEAWQECARVLKPSGWLMVVGPIPTQLPVIGTSGLVQFLELVWIKHQASLNRQKATRPALRHESIHLYHRRGAKAHQRYYDAEAAKTYGHENYTIRRRHESRSQWQKEIGLPSTGSSVIVDGSREATTVLQFPSKCGRSSAPWDRSPHPTQKPLALLRYLIGAWCPPGGLVVDPFAGSGSTLIASRSLGRHWFGIELNPKWHALIIQRMHTVHDFEEAQQ